MKIKHTSIVLVRHGETGHNKNRIVQGQGDVALGEKGLEQADELGPYLKKIDFDRAFVSPLLRARQTFERFGLPVDPRFDDRLMEQHYGDWEDMPFDKLWDADRELMIKFITDPYGFEVPGGETLVQMEERVNSFCDECLPDFDEESKTLVVAHGGSLQLIICRLIGLPVSKHFFGLDVANCSVSVVLRAPGRSILQCLNWRAKGFGRFIDK